MSLPLIRSIFHPSDFSTANQAAFAHALKIAVGAKAELSLLHVGDPTGQGHWLDFPCVRQTLTQWNLVPSGATYDDVANTGLLLNKVQGQGGDVSQELQLYVADHHPDLVVIGTQQHSGPDRWIEKMVAEPINRSAHALTLFVPRRIVGFVDGETGASNLNTILVPMDRNPHPQVAMDAAALFARTLGCKETHFIMLYVGSEQDMPRVNIPWESGWSFEARATPGSVVETILTMAESNDADMIVMAKRGHRNFLDALRGTTTERVVRGTKCPLLVVPATP